MRIRPWLAKKLLTQSFWDDYAARYDRIEGLLSYRNLQDKVLEFIDPIPWLRVLDLGCGTGNTLGRLAEQKVWHAGLFGIDRSPTMLAQAKRKLAESVTLDKGDLDAFAVPESFGNLLFDRLVSVNSLYATKDPEAVLRFWFSLLDDGGLLVLANPHRASIRSWLWEHVAMAIRTGNIRAFLVTFGLIPFIASNLLIKWGAQGKVMHFLSPETLKAMCEKAGFTVLREATAYSGGVVILQLQKDLKRPVRRAQTSQELDMLAKLRFEVYCNEIKSLDPRDYPDGKERDLYDNFAVSFIARDQGEYSGMIRLLGNAQKGFLLEDTCKLPSKLENERSKTFEVSRWIVIPRVRGTGLWYTLVEEAVRWSKQRGYTHWIAACRDRLWNGLQKRGWSVVLWEEYKDYHNTLVAPGELIPPATLYGTVHDNSTRTPGYRFYS